MSSRGDKLEGVDVRQGLPTKNDRPAIQDLVIADLRKMSIQIDECDGRVLQADNVIADIEARKAVGLQRYGTLLQAFNGRDALMDAYQEVLDLCQYLRQCMEEGRWVNVTYDQALRMALHLRTLIEERHAKQPVA